MVIGTCTMSNTDLTENELENLRRMATEAANTPAIAITSAHALAGGASADAYELLHRRVNEIAEAHGLGEGPWGADLNDGFLFR